jgi:hypothetical protein
LPIKKKSHAFEYKNKAKHKRKRGMRLYVSKMRCFVARQEGGTKGKGTKGEGRRTGDTRERIEEEAEEWKGGRGEGGGSRSRKREII